MAAKEGNTNAEYSIEEIKSLVAQYIQHRAEGFSKECFIECDYRTIERHLELYKIELQTEKREVEKAERKGRYYWEKLGKKIAERGEGNATTWIFNMKNRFPEEWREKVETDNKHEHKGEFDLKKSLGFDTAKS